ncbi:MAG: YsnF/AvaK domain-containing protein, partial [Bacteroidota bacterium]|nr:YsnF/AvaK domain-containing protein [Bacteroidota bacterium]
SDDDVLLPLDAAQLSSLPKYDKSMLNREYEHFLRNAFAGLGIGAAWATLPGATDTDFYDHEFYNEDNLYRNRQSAQGIVVADETGAIPIIEEELQVGKRVVETGGARLRKRIIERPIEERVNLREEHVYVERVPVDRPASETDITAFPAGEIEIVEHAEVPVVSKEARVVEEISLEKEVEERQETIRDTIRRTDVEITDLEADDSTTRPKTDL